MKSLRDEIRLHALDFFTLFLVFIGLSIFFLTDSKDTDIALSILCFVLAAAHVFAIAISPVVYILI